MHANHLILLSNSAHVLPFLQTAGFNLQATICDPVTVLQVIDLCCFFIFIHEIKSQELNFTSEIK